MKKYIMTAIVLICILLLPAYANQHYRMDFLAAAETVNNNTTSIHGTGHTSLEIDISNHLAYGAITIIFDSAVPAAVDIEFEFSVSTDRGTSWTTEGSYSIAIPTNTLGTADDIVTWTEPFDFSGISTIRLQRILVGNGAGNCTAIEAFISF
jgi:hypothetical protein